MKKINFSLAVLLFFSSILFAQIPSNVEDKYDAFMEEFTKIFDIIKDNNEAEALSKMEAMKPDLIRLAESFAISIEPYHDLSDEDEAEWDEQIKIQDKPYYKRMMAYYQDPEFQNKWQASKAIQDKMEEINRILDEAMPDENETVEVEDVKSQASVEIKSTNTILHVIPDSDESAIATEDDLGNLTFDIMGYDSGKEISIYFFIEGNKSGMYDWSTEGNFVIEVYDESGEQLNGYWGNEDMGYIQIDQIGNKGDYITGRFSGKFTDDMTDEETLTSISGSFKAKYSDMGY